MFNIFRKIAEKQFKKMIAEPPKPKMELKHFHIGDEEINSDDPQAIIEPLWWSVSIYDGKEIYYTALEQFSVPQRYIFAIQWYLAETYNGGHDQFFYNSTGIVWKEALDGFKAVGLTQCAEILNNAAERMGGEPSHDREERWNVMDELEPEFDDLDSMLYDIDSDEISNALMTYIRTHKENFYFDGDIEVPVYGK